ncbi:MAG: DpnI domain-containing protein [Burkholderiales bacterium]
MSIQISALGYKSASQRARVLTESWIPVNASCPACGGAYVKTPNNTKALDFNCKSCARPFELKSSKTKFGKKVVDGAYESMIAAIREDRQPNLILMKYQLPFSVSDLFILPRRFIVEPMIVARKPLSKNARRAGWVGCNLDLEIIPKSALIPCVINGAPVPQEQIQRSWSATEALENVEGAERGWIAVTLGIVDSIGSRFFSLHDVYAYEARASRLFPNNKNVKAKLRQQLQLLRDMGLIEFRGNGSYALKGKLQGTD